MIGLLESRYPFLQNAQVVASENGAGIEELISSETFAEARSRGMQRVMSALDRSEVEYATMRTDVDRIEEIMSYPYARILVSCVNDKFLTKRYALAEAVHMNNLLGQEPYAVVHQIASELGVKTKVIDDKLLMHFSDYLKYSARIKSIEWKLVNTELKNGYVALSHERFDRVLQNALQDRIESELPLNVPEAIENAIKKDISAVENHLAASKSRYNTAFTGELKPEILPPCIRTLLSMAQNGINLPHSGRFALVSFLHKIGLSLEQILALFAQSPDFDESKSIYQIKHITGDLNGTEGYTPPECGTMKTMGICYEPDELCGQDKMNHPLNYFRIKTRGMNRPTDGQTNH